MAKTKKERPPREPKPRQRHLPKMEPPHFDEIDRAAEAYVDARDTRMECTQEEVKASTALLALMKKHKLKGYEFDGKVVLVVVTDPKEKVKVKSASEAEEEKAGDDADETPSDDDGGEYMKKKRRGRKVVNDVAAATKPETDLPAAEPVGANGQA